MREYVQCRFGLFDEFRFDNRNRIGPFVVVLFLESLTVKSSYYKKNANLQALFQILWFISARYLFYKMHVWLLSIRSMSLSKKKSEKRSNSHLWFSFPWKIKKSHFLQKYKILKFYFFSRYKLYILSYYDTNYSIFESFIWFPTSPKHFWYGFWYGVRRYGLWFSYPTLQVSLSWGSIAESFHSLRSLSVSCFQVILGLPGPSFPLACMPKAVLTAPLERCVVAGSLSLCNELINKGNQ